MVSQNHPMAALDDAEAEELAAYAEARQRLRELPCVQAGWAFGVPEDGQETWLDAMMYAIWRR